MHKLQAGPRWGPYRRLRSLGRSRLGQAGIKSLALIGRRYFVDALRRRQGSSRFVCGALSWGRPPTAELRRRGIGPPLGRQWAGRVWG